MIRVVLPYHLRTLARVDKEVTLDLSGPVTPRALLDALPHLRWVDLDSHGYVVVDVNRARVSGEWWFVDTVLRRSDGERLGASWAVEHGTPRLIPTAELVADAV